MRIALDAMGGDHAPNEIVLGALAGIDMAPGADIVLYGPETAVREACKTAGVCHERISFHDCPQVIEMHESPIEALRKKRKSSLVRMCADARKGIVDAIISAGNTGAFAAAAQLKIGTLEGVSRVGIAVTLPSFHGPVIVCDVGANVAPKPHHLYQYAQMSVCYARAILGIPEPRVGVISIGEEDAKGNDLVRCAHDLIKADTSLAFVGNMEGRDIFTGQANVFICDGFVGNVVLKLTESLSEGIFRTIRREIEADSPQLMKQFEPVVERIWKSHDFAEYGGAPLLGANSVVIICHGRSDRKAVANAIRVAAEQIRLRLNAQITAQLAGHQEDAA